MTLNLTPADIRVTWESLLEKVLMASKQVRELIPTLEREKLQLQATEQSIDAIDALIKQIHLYVGLVGFIRVLWNVTETAHGEAAAITLEQVDDEDRTRLREQIQSALTLGSELVEEAGRFVAAKA